MRSPTRARTRTAAGMQGGLETHVIAEGAPEGVLPTSDEDVVTVLCDGSWEAAQSRWGVAATAEGRHMSRAGAMPFMGGAVTALPQPLQEQCDIAVIETFAIEIAVWLLIRMAWKRATVVLDRWSSMKNLVDKVYRYPEERRRGHPPYRNCYIQALWRLRQLLSWVRLAGFHITFKEKEQTEYARGWLPQWRPHFLANAARIGSHIFLDRSDGLLDFMWRQSTSMRTVRQADCTILPATQKQATNLFPLMWNDSGATGELELLRARERPSPRAHVWAAWHDFLAEDFPDDAAGWGAAGWAFLDIRAGEIVARLEEEEKGGWVVVMTLKGESGNVPLAYLTTHNGA